MERRVPASFSSHRSRTVLPFPRRPVEHDVRRERLAVLLVRQQAAKEVLFISPAG